MNTARLFAKVTAKNRVNETARTLAPRFFAALAPFVGQKIYKVDGTLLAKVKEALPSLVAGDYLDHSAFSLSIVFRTSEEVQGQSGCEYMTARIYLGKIDGAVLTELCPFSETDKAYFRTDYTVKEILDARADIDKARQALSEAQARTGPFGEYDR